MCEGKRKGRSEKMLFVGSCVPHADTAGSNNTDS